MEKQSKEVMLRVAIGSSAHSLRLNSARGVTQQCQIEVNGEV
jgi:hypothetical protein